VVILSFRMSSFAAFRPGSITAASNVRQGPSRRGLRRRGASLAWGLFAFALVVSGCGGPACRMTNLVIDFPQPLPAAAVVHVHVNDQVFDVTCPAQISPPNFAVVAACSDKGIVLNFDLMVPAAVMSVTVSADLSDGTPLFANLPTSLGAPVMRDPVGNAALCDVSVAIVTDGHTPATTPLPGSDSCAADTVPGGPALVASFPYGAAGLANITGLQAAGGGLFAAVDHFDQGTYDVAYVPLPCGPPVALASAAGTLIGGPIAAAGSVFWATTDGVFAVPLAGGAVQGVAPGPLAAPVFFAATTSALFWIDLGGTVQRVDFAGGPATVVAAGWGAGAGIAANDTNVYFSVIGDADWTAGADYGQGGLVLSVPTAGGDVVAVAANQQAPRALTVSATDLYWASAGTHVGDVPAASVGNPDGLIVRQSLAGGAPVVLAAGETNPASLQLLDASPLYPVLYWTGGGLGYGYVAREMPAAGGVPTPASGGDGLTVDADRSYWVDQAFTADGGATFSAVIFSAPR